jgi:hypothetical protein
MTVVGVLALSVLLATSASAAARGVTFTPLGFLDDPGPRPWSSGWNMTDDGSTIAGTPSPFGGCMVWTEATGWVLKGITSSHCDMSRNGMTLASRTLDEGGFEVSTKWNGTDWDILYEDNVPCDFFKNGTFGVSGDGSTIGGLWWDFCDTAGYNWTEETGMFPLDDIVEGSSRVNGLSYDGSVSVGWGPPGRTAVQWIDLVPSYVPHSDDVFIGEANGVVTETGVMWGHSFRNNLDPFAPAQGWSSYDGGEPIGHGYFPWAWFLDNGFAIESSEDGQVIVGAFGFFPRVATLWTPATGLIDINEFLINQGLTEVFEGWFVAQANDITADGKLITGYAFNPDGWAEAFILDITKVKVCHAPPGNPENARTIGIDMAGVGDHLDHGDFFGTCEAAGGSQSRSYDPRERVNATPQNDNAVTDVPAQMLRKYQGENEEPTAAPARPARPTRQGR